MTRKRRQSHFDAESLQEKKLSHVVVKYNEYNMGKIPPFTRDDTIKKICREKIVNSGASNLSGGTTTLATVAVMPRFKVMPACRIQGRTRH